MELKIKKEVEETINLELPAFFKNPKEQEYLGILSEEQAIQFTTLPRLCTYLNGKLGVTIEGLPKIINSWNKISEDDFIAIHEDFLKLQSLQPVLIEHDPNDLNGVL